MKSTSTPRFKDCMVAALFFFLLFSCSDDDIFSEVFSEENLAIENQESDSIDQTEETDDEDNTDEDNTDEENDGDLTGDGENKSPIAIANANPQNGEAPLQVQFDGGNSRDDKGIEEYYWDFKDGSTSSEENPSHEFNNAGTFDVTLTVTDEEGLKHTKTVVITVATGNEAPVAVATANNLVGEAPLQVNFSGSNSSDDKGITSYYWDIPGNPASNANPTRIFDNPGVYDVTLTVTDEEGLQDTADLSITVNPGNTSGGPRIPCGSGGGEAHETGAKVWCWQNIQLPNYNGKTAFFSNDELGIDSECNENQITTVGNELRFYVEPEGPKKNWCDNNYNMRAEVHTQPWNVEQPLGTEEWYGWSYRFGDQYKVDRRNNWMMFQVHPGVVNNPPQIGLIVNKANALGGQAGEIILVNNAKGDGIEKYALTGVIPQAGQKIRIVMHTVWGRGNNGRIRLWINGNLVHDEQTSTVYSNMRWGGNPKWGIYASSWRNSNGVRNSREQGITHLETFMGSLRIITRRPGDPDYGKNSFSEVNP